jgi:hypothetical protein
LTSTTSKSKSSKVDKEVVKRTDDDDDDSKIQQQQQRPLTPGERALLLNEKNTKFITPLANKMMMGILAFFFLVTRLLSLNCLFFPSLFSSGFNSALVVFGSRVSCGYDLVGPTLHHGITREETEKANESSILFKLYVYLLFVRFCPSPLLTPSSLLSCLFSPMLSIFALIKDQPVSISAVAICGTPTSDSAQARFAFFGFGQFSLDRIFGCSFS